MSDGDVRGFPVSSLQACEPCEVAFGSGVEIPLLEMLLGWIYSRSVGHCFSYKRLGV